MICNGPLSEFSLLTLHYGEELIALETAVKEYFKPKDIQKCFK